MRDAFGVEREDVSKAHSNTDAVAGTVGVAAGAGMAGNAVADLKEAKRWRDKYFEDRSKYPTLARGSKRLMEESAVKGGKKAAWGAAIAGGGAYLLHRKKK